MITKQFAKPVSIGTGKNKHFAWEVNGEYFVRSNITGGQESTDGKFTVDFKTGKIFPKSLKLTEILHTIGDEKKSGMIPIDDWRWPDVDHLASMGFGFDGSYCLRTNKEPEMTVYKKKEKDPTTKKKEEYFYLEEEGKPLKRFKHFNDLIDFFDTYPQEEIDKNMQE